MDILGELLRVTPPLRGKWRLQHLWEKHVEMRGHRVARLPGGARLAVDMAVEYERSVWLQREEWSDLRWLQGKLRQGDGFVDVGANLGIWSLVAATVGEAGKVVSLEPNPTTFQRLRENVDRNGLGDTVELWQAAASRQEGTAAFTCEAQHNISALTPTGGDLVGAIQVRTACLDDLLDGRSIAGIKFDAEGHEIAALEGAVRTIERCRPWLVVEFNTHLLPSNRLGEWSVYRLLASLDYVAYTFTGPNKEVAVPPTLTSQGYCNILFQRN